MEQRDGTDWGLQASHETGHDDDGQDLHRPLHANYKKEITQLILAMSGSGRRNWMQTHKLVGVPYPGRHKNHQHERRPQPTQPNYGPGTSRRPRERVRRCGSPSSRPSTHEVKATARMSAANPATHTCDEFRNESCRFLTFRMPAPRSRFPKSQSGLVRRLYFSTAPCLSTSLIRSESERICAARSRQCVGRGRNCNVAHRAPQSQSNNHCGLLQSPSNKTLGDGPLREQGDQERSLIKSRF